MNTRVALGALLLCAVAFVLVVLSLGTPRSEFCLSHRTGADGVLVLKIGDRAKGCSGDMAVSWIHVYAEGRLVWGLNASPVGTSRPVAELRIPGTIEGFDEFGDRDALSTRPLAVSVLGGQLSASIDIH